jgi:hypothetical protein
MTYPILDATAQLTAHPALHNAVIDVVGHFGATGDGSTNDAAAFQAAINAAQTAGPGSVVYAPSPTSSYKISSEVTLKPGVSVVAPRGTPITGGISSGYVFKSIAADSTALDDVTIDGFDINVASLANASGVRIEYGTRVTLKNLRIRNVGSGGWGVLIGVTNGADTTIRNSDILIEDCTFDTHAGTLEQLLLFNSQRVTVRKCRFYNVTNAAGTGIGLYQKLDGVTIEDCTIDPVTGRGSYYSLSTNNISYRGNRFVSGSDGIQGARQSDNGAFSETLVHNLLVEGNHFTAIGDGAALDLGAVRSARVVGNNFIENKAAVIAIHDGYSPVAAQPDDIIIQGNQFRNNNNNGTFHGYNTPIFFSAIGGSQHVEILGNQSWDDQGTKTQRHFVTFSGAFTWDHITVADNRVGPDTANGGQTVATFDAAVLGSNVWASNNRSTESKDVASAATVTLPYHSDYFNITGTTTVTSVTASWIGRRVTLKFAGILTFTDGSNLKLNGNFVTSADDTITLVCDGTNWFEAARSAN